MPNTSLSDPQERSLAAADDFSVDYIYVRGEMQRIKELLPDKYPNYAVMAEKSKLSESTLKKFLAGDILNPRCNTLYQICSTFALDIRRVMRLMPKGQSNERDETMLELRHQIVRLEDQLDKQTEELGKLRDILNSTATSKAEAEANAAALARSEARLNKQLCRHRWIMFVLVMSMIAIIVIRSL